jgi:hypothetical protein
LCEWIETQILLLSNGETDILLSCYNHLALETWEDAPEEQQLAHPFKHATHYDEDFIQWRDNTIDNWIEDLQAEGN